MRVWRYMGALLGLGALSLWLPGRLTVVSAQETPPPRPAGETLAFAGGGGSWAWLHADGPATEVRMAFQGGPPTTLARGEAWSDLAVEGAYCWVLSRARGTLERLSLSPGSQAEEARLTVFTGMANAGALGTAPGRVFWLEGVAAQSPLGLFVAPAGPRLRVRRLAASGEVSTLGEWPAGALDEPRRGDLIGVTRDEVIVRARRPYSTEFVAFPQAGGGGRRLAVEAGQQQGLLYRGELYRTARSAEAPPQTEVVRVRRGREQEAETVAEWLPPVGQLLGARGGVYYAGPQLYRLPNRLGPARVLGKLTLPGRYASDGAAVIRIDGPAPRVALAVGE